MEALKISVDDKRFDELVHCGTPEHGDLEIAVKEDATTNGHPAIVVSFTANIDGKLTRVQAVTTLRNFLGAVTFLKAKYPDL